MKLDKAIEIITKWKEEGVCEDAEELHAAEQLAIEALKRLESMRSTGYHKPWELLPSETPPDPQPAISVDTSNTEGLFRRPK